MKVLRIYEPATAWPGMRESAKNPRWWRQGGGGQPHTLSLMPSPLPRAHLNEAQLRQPEMLYSISQNPRLIRSGKRLPSYSQVSEHNLCSARGHVSQSMAASGFDRKSDHQSFESGRIKHLDGCLHAAMMVAEVATFPHNELGTAECANGASKDR